MPGQEKFLRAWNMTVYSDMCYNEETMDKKMKREVHIRC